MIKFITNALNVCNLKNKEIKKLQEECQLEKRKREVYEKGYTAVKKSYNELLYITKDLVVMVGNEHCDPNEIYRTIESSTKFNEVTTAEMIQITKELKLKEEEENNERKN